MIILIILEIWQRNKMKITKTSLPDVLLLTPTVHSDERGQFLEMFQIETITQAIGELYWTQDNLSRSDKGTVRGLHFQWPNPQGKLVTAVHGKIFDVAVDIRNGSPFFGKWVGQTLDDKLHQQLWIPPGFAHGFQALTNSAIVHYKCSENLWSPESELTICFDDPRIDIKWPLPIQKIHIRDRNAPTLEALENLPNFEDFSPHVI